jgi:signal peptidase II
MSDAAGAADAPEAGQDAASDDPVTPDPGPVDAVDAGDAVETVPQRRTLVVPMVIAAIVVVLDQITKHWALNTLDDRDIEVFWTLQFNLAFNTGMAFSRGEGLGPVIAVVALVVVVFFLVRLGREGGRLAAVATGLIVGGAIGNIIDRAFRGDGILDGAVVDFIDFQWFPIFNIADMGITIGGALLVLSSVLPGRPT